MTVATQEASSNQSGTATQTQTQVSSAGEAESATPRSKDYSRPYGMRRLYELSEKLAEIKKYFCTACIRNIVENALPWDKTEPCVECPARHQEL